jgi:hypothetical protein
MSGAWFDATCDEVASLAQSWLQGFVCPTLVEATNALPNSPYLHPGLWRPIWNLIHALVICHKYAPNKFNNYSVKVYFGVCLIAMSPSYTLRALVMGQPWGFVLTREILLFLAIGMFTVLILGGLPKRILSPLQLLNQMSTVLSVRGGVQYLQQFPGVTSSGCILVGILHGGGGTLWWILVNSWFGEMKYRWERINEDLPKWVAISVVWNIFFWSECSCGSNLVEISLFVILVSHATLRSTLKKMSSKPNVPKAVHSNSIIKIEQRGPTVVETSMDLTDTTSSLDNKRKEESKVSIIVKSEADSSSSNEAKSRTKKKD